MPRKALIVKQKRLQDLRDKCYAEWKKMPRPTRFYNRCQLSWRSRAYMREFWVSRVMFRKYAREWLIVWVKKSSW